MFAYLGDRLGMRTEKSVIIPPTDALQPQTRCTLTNRLPTTQPHSRHRTDLRMAGAASRAARGWYSRSDTRSLQTLPWQARRDDPMRNNETSTTALH